MNGLSGGLVFVRGGGDLASGVALRLHRSGMQVVIAELPEPLAVRRLVSFAQAVYQGEMQVEDVHARLVSQISEIEAVLASGAIPVVVDTQAKCLEILRPAVLVDGRMLKHPPETDLWAAPLTIGLGPGFIAGENCHAVIETCRGHRLGSVIWQGSAEADTGIPENVAAHSADRVLRAPASGVIHALANIGDHVEKGQPIADVSDQLVTAPFNGVLRGLLHSGLKVTSGMKIGDVDPRDDPRYCYLVSDKALAIGGGVLEAVLTQAEIRKELWKRDAAN